MLDPYAPCGPQNTGYPSSSLYSSSSSTPLPPMTPAVAPTATAANPAHLAVSPLSDPDADASTDDSDTYPAPTRPLAGLNGDKIDLQAVDPDLYGLRRSVSRFLRPTHTVLTASHLSWSWSYPEEEQRDCEYEFSGPILCAYLSLPHPKRSSKSSSDDDADADGDDDEDYHDNKAAKRKRNRAAIATKGKFVAANRPPRSFPSLTSSMLVSRRIAKDTPETNHSGGGSDSDYGAPSRKKKRTAAPNEDFRFSSRGNRVLNYAENDDDEEDASGDDDDMMDIDGVAHISAGPEEEVHEIEGVFDHHRDEERKKDPQDDFYTNIVRQSRQVACPAPHSFSPPALPRQVERLLSPS